PDTIGVSSLFGRPASKPSEILIRRHKYVILTKRTTMKLIKHFAFIFIIVPSFLLSSCDRCEKGSGNVISVIRNVPSFHQVTLRGSYNLYLRQDSVQKVEVVADDNIAPHLETIVENNNLIIRQRKSECTKKSTRTDV